MKFLESFKYTNSLDVPDILHLMSVTFTFCVFYMLSVANTKFEI